LSLDDRLLQEYIDRFYGYGNYAGSFWLVGMEEGGGDSLAEVQSRIAAWEHRGKPEVDDVAEFHALTGLDKWFRRDPPLQRTWAKLIRLLLVAEGQVPEVAAAKAFQGAELGRRGSRTCILELLPLPSPSSSEWLYSSCSSIASLRDRNTYREHVAPMRVQHLRTRIREHQPALVLFYGLVYRNWWEQVSGVSFDRTEIDAFYLATSDTTLFALTRHPTHTGVTNRYFEEAGRLVRTKLGKPGGAVAPATG
jgi:hypothetical protein